MGDVADLGVATDLGPVPVGGQVGVDPQVRWGEPVVAHRRLDGHVLGQGGGDLTRRDDVLAALDDGLDAVRGVLDDQTLVGGTVEAGGVDELLLVSRDLAEVLDWHVHRPSQGLQSLLGGGDLVLTEADGLVLGVLQVHLDLVDVDVGEHVGARPLVEHRLQGVVGGGPDDEAILVRLDGGGAISSQGVDAEVFDGGDGRQGGSPSWRDGWGQTTKRSWCCLPRRDLTLDCLHFGLECSQHRRRGQVASIGRLVLGGHVLHDQGHVLHDGVDPHVGVGLSA